MFQTAAIGKMETSVRHIMIGWRERDRDGGSVRVRRVTVNVAEDRHREAVDPTEESKVGECG
jgi:hypothetical protein